MDPTYNQLPTSTNEPTTTPPMPAQSTQPGMVSQPLPAYTAPTSSSGSQEQTVPQQSPYAQPAWQPPAAQPALPVQPPSKRRGLVLGIVVGVLFLVVLSIAIWYLSRGAIRSRIPGLASGSSQSGAAASMSMQNFTGSLFSIQYPNGWYNDHSSTTDGSIEVSEFTDGSDNSNTHGAKNGFMAINGDSYDPHISNELEANDLYQEFVVSQDSNPAVTGYAETTGYQSSNPELSQPDAVVITAQLTSNEQVTAHVKIIAFTNSSKTYTYGIVEQVETSQQSYQDIFTKMEQSFKGA